MSGSLLLLMVPVVLCLSCAPLRHLRGPDCGTETTLDIRHQHSKRPADCLSLCVNMVLQYYGVNSMAPDSVLPLELISLSKRLNDAAPVDAEGHKLFAAVLAMSPEELAGELLKQRPLIVIFKPSEKEVYHSVVTAGFCPAREQFYIHDPSRRKPQWKTLSRLPTFAQTGKYLVLLIGVQRT